MTTPIPELTPVTRSSTVDAVGYDDQQFVLTIRFRGGNTYQYTNVGPWMYKKLMEAPSIGSWFAQYIKNEPQRHPCTKLDAPETPRPANEFDILQDRVAALERQVKFLAGELIVATARLNRHDTHSPAGALPVEDWPS